MTPEQERKEREDFEEWYGAIGCSSAFHTRLVWLERARRAEAEVQALRADAERYRWLREHVKEQPLRPAAYGSEIAPDMRLRHSFPDLVSYDAIGQQISLDEAIDRASKEGA